MFHSLKHLEAKERRCKHAAVAVGGDMFSFGGIQKGGAMDVRIFDTAASTWKEPKASASENAPSMRYSHTAVLIGNTVYLWGGFKDHSLRFCNELYAFDVDEHTWSVPDSKGNLPEEMEGHSACASGNVMYIYGLHTHIGFRRDKFSSGMSKLDTTSMVWSSLRPEGDERLSVYHSATIIGTRMFVFGGRPTESRMVYNEEQNSDDNDDDSWGHFNDIRVFDTTTESWLQPAAGSSSGGTPRPKGREGHSAFAHNGELYIFGGCGAFEITSLNDLWRFDPRDSSWHELPLKGEAPSRRHRMCSCTVGSRVVLSGGAEGPKDIDLGTEEVSILDLS